jgi:hypothetical protein
MKYKFVKSVEVILVFLSVLFIAGSAYLIGKMQANNSKVSEIQIVYPDAVAIKNSNSIEESSYTKPATNTQASENKTNTQKSQSQIVASKNGKRYYYSNCSGVKRIKPENLIYFDTKAQAEAKGLTLASGCKEL